MKPRTAPLYFFNVSGAISLIVRVRQTVLICRGVSYLIHVVGGGQRRLGIDLLQGARAAVEEGVVPGGGMIDREGRTCEEPEGFAVQPLHVK